MSDRQKVIFALLASAALHAVAVLFLTAWTRLHPREAAGPERDAEPLEVTLLPAPAPPPVTLAASAPTPTPPPKVTRTELHELDADGLAGTEKPPENPMFETDRNSHAASEQPATGDAPLPSQAGKERPFAEWKNQDYSLGKGAQPAPVMEMAKAAPSVAGLPSAPAPEPSLAPESAKAAETPEPQPTPAQTPAPSPTPEPTATPPDAIALGKPTPTPAPSPTPKQLAKLVSPPALRAHTEAPRPQPAQPVEPGYQPQRERTKVDGGITNRGKAGVDAVATPLGRYKKSIADAVGSRWYHYVNQQMDLITVGEVHIKFRVTASGHVEDVKIVSNTANDSFGGFCVRSVSEARIPPMPPEVAPALVDGKLEIDYHFNIYPQ